MKLKTIALHLAYDLGSAAIGLAADKIRTVLVQRKRSPKEKGNDLHEISDHFEEGPIKVDARMKPNLSEGGVITGLGHSDGPVVLSVDVDSLYLDGKKVSAVTASPFVKIDGEAYMRNAAIHGKLELEQKRFIGLTEDDVSAINYGVNSIYHTHRQKGPVATINRDDLTKIFNILSKLQQKANENVNS